MFFSWSSKWRTNKMPWLWIPPRGKLEKKAACSSSCENETATLMTKLSFLECPIEKRYGWGWYWLFVGDFKKQNANHLLLYSHLARLCHRKWLMFFWSSKGITGKMPWLWIPQRGRLEKKAVCSPCCGEETTTCHDEPTAADCWQNRLPRLPGEPVFIGCG